LGAAAEVGKGITSILDLDELLHETVDIICDAYGFYYAGVFLLDEAGEWAVLRAGHGEAGAKMVELGHKLQIGGLSMIGTSIAERKARIALDVGDEPVHFKNPHLPLTRSEMALPLIVGDKSASATKVIGALTVQSVEEAAFSDEDVSSLQSMADQLAIALDNARLLRELEAAHAELVRTKTFEALATSTLEAIHWIGNKTLPITVSVKRVLGELEDLPEVDPEVLTDMREDLGMIQDSAQLILEVQEHLIGPARERRPMPAMVDDVLKDVTVRMGIPTDMLTYDVASNLPLIVTDTTQLSRAFGYVLKNALEATEGTPNPQIHVEIEPAEEKGTLYVAVRIADNGPGIPPEEMEKIWAAFYTTKGAKHAGMGLSATYRTVKQLEGKISATNTPEGAPVDGAIFEFLLPIYEGTQQKESLPLGRSVLLIDDVDAWSQAVEQALLKADNKVERAPEGEADFSKFDFIFVDDALEKRDTLKVLKALSSENLAKRTWVFASSLRVERTMKLMRYGVQDVLLKPYDLAGLGEILS
jgi:signal transduction histidine kinase